MYISCGNHAFVQDELTGVKSLINSLSNSYENLTKEDMDCMLQMTNDKVHSAIEKLGQGATQNAPDPSLLSAA